MPKLQKHAKGQRPNFFDDPAVDKLLAMLLASFGEVSVLRDRLDTVERLIEEKALFSRAEIENYKPSKGVLAERDEQREQYLSQVLRIIDIDVDNDQMGRNDESPEWQSVIDSVTTPS